jgi:capsular exopolysaccharide synthesis family protein
MEKIKQALEKARQTRAAKRTIRTESTQRKPPDTSLDTQITYTQTRVIEPSKVELRQKRIILGDEQDAVSTAYKILRTHVLQRLTANQWRTLVITSPTERNGKTLTAINLAISLAKDTNHSVLLADLDLRRPSVKHYFIEKSHPGISEYLVGDVKLNKVLFNPGIDRLVILPGNHSFTNSSEMLSSPRMVKLVEELKNRYANRIIIFDMPPLLSCDDVIAFSPYIDAIILVVEEDRTRKDDLKRAYELIKDRDLLGTVLNKSDNRTSVYGYYR